jgi:hypothetical protein
MSPYILDDTLTPKEYATDFKSLIFLCVFVFIAIGVFIWWLRR